MGKKINKNTIKTAMRQFYNKTIDKGHMGWSTIKYVNSQLDKEVCDKRERRTFSNESANEEGWCRCRFFFLFFYLKRI